MNILFLGLEVFNSIDEPNMYADILREFEKRGHMVYSISPIEKRYQGETRMITERNSRLLRLRIGNIQKTNLVEKGISTLSIERLYMNAIKKHFKGVRFDLILYVTPPITFCKVIEFLKKRDRAFTYLMLKDIFPQNAVDLGMLKKRVFFPVIYKYFRNKEKRLYDISDKIGCMSPANMDYILSNNSYLKRSKVEECPNCIEVVDKSTDIEDRIRIREKYNIPIDKTVFVYGGNLGKPQGIPFIIECLKAERENKDIFFLVVGDGTEYSSLEKYYKSAQQNNFKLMKRLPKGDYDTLVGACDVGLLFLDYRFTIPNFPSRLLSYMQARLPVLACTDPNTDVGDVIENAGFGWQCRSNNVKEFKNIIKNVLNSNLSQKGNAAMEYLSGNYSAKIAYEVIVKEIK